MRSPPAAIDLIKRFEGCRLEAYRCPRGILTIGYGHTVDVREGMRITQHQADVILESDVGLVEDELTGLCEDFEVNANEFGALVSLAFNVGCRAVERSTLLRKLSRGDRNGAAAEFQKWVHAGDKVLPGLVARRAAERALFLTPVATC
jgi:lysozyme